MAPEVTKVLIVSIIVASDSLVMFSGLFVLLSW